MKRISLASLLLIGLYFLYIPVFGQALSPEQPKLIALFREWRKFEQPPMRQSAPDYTATTFNNRQEAFKVLQQQLLNMDTTGWTPEQRTDWNLVRAEMNGYDFNYRILQPWTRDPAFYKTLWTERSDVPAHEGPTHHRLTEVWTYSFPLTEKEKARLISDLKVIPALNDQAMLNLTGNARELWIAGIRDIKGQEDDLKELLNRPGVKKDPELSQLINDCIVSTHALAAWLEKQAPLKSGPSGIGKENYSWYLENVLLSPMTWEDEVQLLKKELSRAWTSLKLEEVRNRNLPELKAAANAKEYSEKAEQSVKQIIDFLHQSDFVTVKDYFEPALREHMGQFVPEAKRHFFWITAHYDPRPLFSHFYHWFELARMDREPHAREIRRGAMLYNIFSQRNEGMATAVEELFMQAGLYDKEPRGREIVYILLAQRAARGLGSLYAHANMISMEEAGKIHSDYTPRGWMKTEPELRIFEQHLYMRQPGYGSSYITGKYMMEALIAEYAKYKESQNQPFLIKEVMDKINAAGCIPFSLVEKEIIPPYRSK